MAQSLMLRLRAQKIRFLCTELFPAVMPSGNLKKLEQFNKTTAKMRDRNLLLKLPSSCLSFLAFLFCVSQLDKNIYIIAKNLTSSGGYYIYIGLRTHLVMHNFILFL